jgi:hypothetical protein
MGDPRFFELLRYLSTLFNIQAVTFDDQSWTVRYLVVETGNWLKGRQVLIPSVVVGAPKWEKQTLPVRITNAQVESSLQIDADKPVSRRMEEELQAHYGWPPYWVSTRALAAVDVINEAIETEDVDLTLRSADEVRGYDIQATDGKIGYVADIIADDEDWSIRYIVVDIPDWIYIVADAPDWIGWPPRKQVLVSPAWIHVVTWPERDIYVGLSRKAVKDSPEFDPSVPVNQEYEIRLYDYYGRPKHWMRV